MFKQDHSYSTVSAVMPNRSVGAVVESIFERSGANALMWKARGTLVRDHWRQRWLPAVSPARTMMQMLVPDPEVEAVVSKIVREARLDQQATGAVFSSPCVSTYLGSGFNVWPEAGHASSTANDAKLAESMSAIFCIVGHDRSDRVCRAAMDAGAHGPIVYYSEGQGLRDRLGWLRITKEAEKEVLMVMADQADVEEVFTAMSKAAQLHLPGRGFMYKLPVTAGLYNLPSRVSHHHYEANMQQVINAIDHLAGHTHWRDQLTVDIGGGMGTGLNTLTDTESVLEDQKCLTAIVDRDQVQDLTDLLLAAGAPGLNVIHPRLLMRSSGSAGGSVRREYSQLRCIATPEMAAQICSAIEEHSAAAGIEDLCVFIQEAPKVATYVPGRKKYRETDAA